MPDYIKLNSDRPDYEVTLREPDGAVVDLTSANAVYLLMWDEAGNLLINDIASIGEAALGEVRYDFRRGQIVSAGTNEIEIRVEWNDGDRQWFPTDEPGYDLEVVASAGDRSAELQEADAETDAEVHQILVHDSISVQDDDGEMAITGGDVAITAGDLDVSGTVTIGDLKFGDDDPLVFGTNDDFEATYDSTADEWQLRNGISDIDVIQVAKGGNVTFPNGATIAESHTVETDNSEANLEYQSTAVGTEAFVRALLEDGGAISDSVVTISDAAAGVGPIQLDGVAGDATFDGSVEIGGDTAATRAWATAQNIAHADLGSIGTDDHHNDFIVEDSQTEVSTGTYRLDFGDSLDVTLDGPRVTVDNAITAQYDDEAAQDAVGDILNTSHFDYDDTTPEISFVPGNVAHDDHSGINGTNHHAALTVEDSGTGVSTGNYTLDFGTDLSASLSGSTVTVDATGGGGTGYSDADAIDAINTDTDHGSTASHDYFGGAHSDLSGVASDDHHAQYTNEQAQDAVGNNVGDGLAYDDANAEVAQNVVASGSVTLSSGTETIDTGVATSETATFMVALGPATDDADVGADVRSDSGSGNYEVDVQETDTSVGNPTVEYDIVRVR